jgi:basic amino acid/polyamine antiporter, APA family
MVSCRNGRATFIRGSALRSFSTILVGLCVAIVAALTPLSVISELVSIGTLLAFVIVCAGIWILRTRDKTVPRPFVVPWVPITPIMGIAVSLLMIVSLGWESWARLVVWLSIGLAIYFAYGRKHSRLRVFRGID